MKRKIVTAALLCALSMSMIFGCGKKEEKKEEPETKALEVETTKEPEVQVKVIGTKTEKSFEVKMTNGTGQDISAISVKSSEEEAYPENMLTAPDVFLKDETRILYYEPKESTEEQATETGKVIPTAYSIQLTLADSSVFELHSFPFEEMKEGAVKLQDGIAYVTYKGADSDSEISTLDAELATKAAAEAEAAAQAQSQAEAEAAAQAQAEAEAAAAAAASQSQQTYTEPEPTYSEPEPEPDQSWAPPTDNGGGGEDDGCVGDGLTY